MDPKKIQELLELVKGGQVEIDEAVQRLRQLPYEDVGFACIDHHRQIRCGFPEVIFCPSKTATQVAEIFKRLAETGNTVMATRAQKEVFETVQSVTKLEGLQYYTEARIIILKQKQPDIMPGKLTIVTAGTADLPVANEAKVTAEHLGCQTELLCDVGVAGLHRLLGHIPVLHRSDVIIVIAGMEGALASVVGGLVDCPVVAVPTSVGYGASFEGISALLTMLNSCASGITVVNIDNGFGAAYAAAMMLRKMDKG